MLTHRQLFNQAWPYTLSASTGFLTQLVTDAQVAKFGTPALAAMGVAISACFLPTAATMGLTTALQRRCAALIDQQELNRAISSGIFLAILLAFPFVLAFSFLPRAIASVYIKGQPLDLATHYLRFYAPCFFILAISQVLSGYWLGTLQARSRLIVTLFSTAFVAGSNLFLIPRFGIAGGAIGSLFGLSAGVALNLAFLFKRENYRWAKPTFKNLAEDVQVVLGVSLHQLSLGFLMSCTTILVGKIGINALAVASVVGTLSLPALYVGLTFGTTSGSYLLKALNTQISDDAEAIERLAITQVFAFASAYALGLVLAAKPIREFFFRDPVLYSYSQNPILLLALLVFVDSICCSYQRFMFISVSGIRASFQTMSIIQWGLFLPCAWLAITFTHLTYTEFLILHLAQRALIVVALRRGWKRQRDAAVAASKSDLN